MFVPKELHGWEHETALVDYRNHRSEFCEQLLRIPDRSTLWHSWHERSTVDLRDDLEGVSTTVLLFVFARLLSSIRRAADLLVQVEHRVVKPPVWVSVAFEWQHCWKPWKFGYGVGSSMRTPVGRTIRSSFRSSARPKPRSTAPLPPT